VPLRLVPEAALPDVLLPAARFTAAAGGHGARALPALPLRLRHLLAPAPLPPALLGRAAEARALPCWPRSAGPGCSVRAAARERAAVCRRLTHGPRLRIYVAVLLGTPTALLSIPTQCPWCRRRRTLERLRCSLHAGCVRGAS